MARVKTRSRLRRLRDASGLYARDVASAVGMPLRVYQAWEVEGFPPQVLRAVRMARVLGCTVEDMVGGDGEPDEKA